MSAFSLRKRLAMAAAGAAVLGAVLPAAAAGAATPGRGITSVNVPTTGTFVDTGVFLRTDLALVTGQGAVFDGGLWGPYGDSSCVAPITAPAPGLPCDALVGRIGTTGTPFVVGNSDYVRLASSGELYLAVNSTSAFGGFHSTITQLP
jgi:hypothetical protein